MDTAMPLFVMRIHSEDHNNSVPTGLASSGPRDERISPSTDDINGTRGQEPSFGTYNESFDLSPEVQGCNMSQTTTTVRTEMNDKEIKKSFLYPSLGDSERKGNNSQERKGDNDVTFTNHVTGDCGLSACRPQCLQRFKSIGCFTAVYGLSGIVTSALSVYISSQITTLEKHFNFNSSVSGLLMSCNDFGYFLTCLFLSYLARRVHIPRALALSTIVYGISGIVCTIPYFGTRDQLKSSYLSANNNGSTKFPSQMCTKSDITNTSTQASLLIYHDNNNNVNSCDPSGSRSEKEGDRSISEHWRTLAITIIAIGMTLQGAAKSPRQSFVGVYIDDNVVKTKTSLYLGIIVGMGILGPAIAFIMGGAFSSIYITLEETQLSVRDPRWLGAWWLGFLVFGSVSLVVGIPVFCFPRKLRVKEEIEKAERKRKENSEGKNRIIWEIKGFLKTTLKLVLNPMYMFLAVSSGLLGMSIAGFLGFMPKYLEVHFNMTTWKVNVVFGAVSVISAACGSMLGGFITTRFKLSPYACLKLVVGTYTLMVVVEMIGFFIKCDQPTFNSGSQGVVGNGSECSSNCQCAMDSYFPVCGDDGLNYFSPCHAGCKGVIGGKIFSNCSCLSSPHLSQARGGLCGDSCEHKFWIYTVLTFVTHIVSATSIMPGFIVSIRSVNEAQKPMAIGIKSFLGTLIGWFPGPIVFGSVIDTTCLIARTSSCNANTRGACLLYDLASFRNKFHGLLVGLQCGSLFLVVCALLYAALSSESVFQSRQNDDEEDENERNKTKSTSSSLPSSKTTF